MQYLTRSASALYAGYGALMLFLSFSVRRYQPVIIFKAVLGVVFGVMMLILDLAIGMPWHWAWFEGPSIIVLSLVLIWASASAVRRLARLVSARSARSSSSGSVFSWARA